LAGENRERKIPRRDRDEDAAPAQPQYVALAGRAGQALLFPEQRAPFRGVVAAEIDGLAYFRDRVVERLARFPLQERKETGFSFREEIGGALKHAGAGLGECRGPC